MMRAADTKMQTGNERVRMDMEKETIDSGERKEKAGAHAQPAYGTFTRRLVQLYAALLYNANLKGFLDEMRDEGVIIPDERLLLFGTEQRMNWQSTPEGKAFVERLMRHEVDCMTCYNDVFASSLMSILQERGMKLPDEMGFIGFDNAVYAEMTNPKLTTLGHPKEAFGSLVAEKLLRMISGERERSVNMAWTLIERDSLPRVDRNA